MKILLCREQSLPFTNKLITLFLVVLLPYIDGIPLRAQQVDDLVEQSLLSLRAAGTHRATGATVESTSNGFLISKAGLALTVYSLVADLTPETIRIDAASSLDPQKTLSVTVISHSPDLDLLLLKVPSLKDRDPVALGSAEALDPHAVLYSQSVDPRTTDVGRLENQLGPEAHLWTVEGFNFTDQQRGAPVYTETGEVIGLAYKDAYMIPIDFATAMVAPARIEEILQSIKRTPYQDLEAKLAEIERDINLIREQIFWTVDLAEPTDGGSPGDKVIKVGFQKMLSGELPTKLAYKVRLRHKDLDKEIQNPTIMNSDVDRDAPVTDERRGTFTIPGIGRELENLKHRLGDPVVALEVTVVPVFSDGKQGDRVNRTILHQVE